jgi:hypothetical protein
MARFRFSPNSRHIAALHRLATNRVSRDEDLRMAVNLAKLPEIFAPEGRPHVRGAAPA